ncbi:MAG TPA: hypothetical protein VLI90_10305 [Tepidisphaeraceae bacterium]|nr:hypothetical protein [Tepidisphaeraceae bacterium]
MDLDKINVKLFTKTDTFAPAEFVPIFHHWIQEQSLPGHLLIDVADYAHVPAGPGTLVVASEANIHMDRTENRLGLLYVRKQPIVGAATLHDRIRAVIAEALHAAAKMQHEPECEGRLDFRTDEISIRFNDRLLAPNTPETLAALKPAVEAVAKKLFANSPVTVELHDPSPLVLLDLRVKTNGSTTIEQLLERAGAQSLSN